MLAPLVLFVVTFIMFSTPHPVLNRSFSELAEGHKLFFMLSMCSLSIYKIIYLYSKDTIEYFFLLISFISLGILSIFTTNSHPTTHKIASYFYFTNFSLLNLYLGSVCNVICFGAALLYLYAHINQIKYRLYIEYVLIVLQIYLFM